MFHIERLDYLLIAFVASMQPNCHRGASFSATAVSWSNRWVDRQGDLSAQNDGVSNSDEGLLTMAVVQIQIHVPL